MIDIKQVYEDARRRENGHTESYSINTPNAAMDFLKEPIDLNNPVKWIRTERAEESPVLYERTPKKGAFGRFGFGPGIDLEVDCEKPVRLFADGSAEVSFADDEAYWEAVQKYDDLVKSLPDKNAQIGAAETKARSDAEAEFDPDGIYGTAKGTGNKVALRNQRQAVAKKKALWQRETAKRVERAKAGVVRDRNAAVLATGVGDAAVRLMKNGSFEYYGATLRFLPTALDLARMFDFTVSVPTEFFLAVDRNDSAVAPTSAEFSAESLAESYDAANGTKAGQRSLFGDIRDCEHSHGGDGHSKMPFPIEKKTRWDNMCARFGARQVPISQFPGLSEKTFRQNGKVWDGETGRVLLKTKETMPGGKPQYAVMTVDGLVVIYPGQTAELPTTAFFMTPHQLAFHLRIAEPRPRNVSVNMIRRTFLNLADAMKEKNEMFFQKGGTRRYVP